MSGGEFRLYPKGTSMLPLLRQGIDSVVLVSADSVSVNDMVLYRRDDGQFVLHRIIKINGDELVMCGDNQYELEYGIRKEHILARVCSFYYDNELISLDNEKYLKYVKGLPKRRRKNKIRAKFASLKEKIFKK